jgi:hypothetical protein
VGPNPTGLNKIKERKGKERKERKERKEGRKETQGFVG